jgi:SAM-dependent methyltransferase
MYLKESNKLVPDWHSYDFLIHRFLYSSLFRAKEFMRGRLLDVGCGSKPYEKLLFDSVSEHVGIDIPIEESANKNKKKADIYYDINLGLPFESRTFDSVLCTEVLEHIPEPGKLIREINRVLKTGGHLVLTAPQVWGLHEVPHDYYRFTEYGLRYLAEKCGFKIIWIEKEGGIFVMLGQRLIAFIHYSFVHNRNILFKIFFKMFYIFLGRICLLFDMINKHRGDTLGNIILAEKVSNC